MNIVLAQQAVNRKTNEGFLPAITLMFIAPLLAEVLPGATRFSSLFVFPIEMMVWGGGAVLVRYVVRKKNLRWVSMLLLALSLAVAEECIIQQTSVASLVIQLKGQEYARAFGFNYVYFLWAIIYEPVFVIFLSIYLVELMFPTRKNTVWLNKRGVLTVIALFVSGSLLAWYTWTQIARIKVFHLKPYHPSLFQVLFSLLVILLLCDRALKIRKMKRVSSAAIVPFSPLILGIAGGIWATLLFGLLLLAFGISPDLAPTLAVLTGILLALLPIIILPRITRSKKWTSFHEFGLISGTVVGSMVSGQIGFFGATIPDQLFKIISNIIAVIFLIMLGHRLKKHESEITSSVISYQ